MKGRVTRDNKALYGIIDVAILSNSAPSGIIGYQVFVSLEPHS